MASPATELSESSEASKLYLEDLYPGRRFSSPARYFMDPRRIKEFAAEFDPQPFHTDEASAAGHSVFRGLAASGWHTAAATMRLMNESDLKLANGLVSVGGEMTWPRPTRPGDALRLEIEILEIKPSRSKPKQGMAGIRFTTLNQREEEVQILTAWVLVYRRDAP